MSHGKQCKSFTEAEQQKRVTGPPCEGSGMKLKMSLIVCGEQEQVLFVVVYRISQPCSGSALVTTLPSSSEVSKMTWSTYSINSE